MNFVVWPRGWTKCETASYVALGRYRNNRAQGQPAGGFMQPTCVVAASLSILGVLLAGCAQYQWYKPGITQQEANGDHYDCLQGSQQRVATAQVNMYGGSSQNAMVTNQNLYKACLAARGYEWRQGGQRY